ncbi:alpha/beta fold hydrolase [Photobacterium sagamiensis]|uniref:alpha/beta hydrolase n=1 Tax=Photobacterium sagamiensis TaxID=2910241 RepID=UPI003D12B2CB
MCKAISLLFILILTQGCANTAFYAPSQASSLNPDVRWLHSLSGNDIAYLWIPAATRNNSNGIIVHFHGNSGHMEQTREKVDWLAAHGYDVLVFDYSGFGHSTGDVSDKAAYLDAISVLSYIEQLRDNTMLPSFVIATSTGGNIFMRAWADNPIYIDGMIIDSSFTSYIDVTKYVLEKGMFSKLYAWMAHLLMRDDYAAKAVVTHLPETKSLVIHCVADRIVPIEYGEAIYRQLNGDKEFWRMESCGHARAITRSFPETQLRIVRWLEQATPASVVARFHSTQTEN